MRFDELGKKRRSLVSETSVEMCGCFAKQGTSRIQLQQQKL
jgi:hypothetical protein